jgi:hypothetical protein
MHGEMPVYITTNEGGICDPGKWKLIEGVWRLDGKPINIQAGLWQPHSGWAAAIVA